jgi:hypothetical protein
MITIDNYFERTAGVDFEQLPEALAKGHTLVSGAAQNNWEHYHKVDTIKRVVNAYFEKLDSYLKSHAPSQKSKATAPEQTVKPTRERNNPEKLLNRQKLSNSPKVPLQRKQPKRVRSQTTSPMTRQDIRWFPSRCLTPMCSSFVAIHSWTAR